VIWSEITAGALEFFTRAQHEGLLAPDTDLMWARRVYYALVDEAQHGGGAGLDSDQVRYNADALATLVVDTFLRGTVRDTSHRIGASAYGPSARPSALRSCRWCR